VSVGKQMSLEGFTVCSYNRPTYAPDSRTMAFTPQCSPATTRYF